MELTSLFPRESSEAEQDYQARVNALAHKVPTLERIAEALCPESLGLPDGERALRLARALEEVDCAVAALKTELERCAWLKTLLAAWKPPKGTSSAVSVLREASGLLRALSQEGAFRYLFEDDGLDPFRGCWIGTRVERDGWEVSQRVAPAAVTRAEAADCAKAMERLAMALSLGAAALSEEVADSKRADLRPATRRALNEAKTAIQATFIAHAAPSPPPPVRRRGRPKNLMQQRFEDFARAVCELHGLDVKVGHKNFAMDWPLPSDFFQT